MNCLQAEENFSAHFEDSIDYNSLQRFESHLDECSECQQDYAQFRETIEISQQLPQVEPSPFFLTALNNKLLVENSESLSFLERIRRTINMPRWTLSGAVLLFVVATSVFFVYQDDIFNPENQTLNPNRPTVSSQTPQGNRNQMPPNPDGISNHQSAKSSQSMQQHYTLKQVSYSVDTIGGGL